jgi:hypothetical protein
MITTCFYTFFFQLSPGVVHTNHSVWTVAMCVLLASIKNKLASIKNKVGLLSVEVSGSLVETLTAAMSFERTFHV